MSTLSWLLYFAEVSSNLGNLGIIIGVLSLLVSVPVTMGVVFVEERDKTEAWAKYGPKIQKGLYVLAALGLTVGCILPSQNTVYMIIASESAQAVVASDSGQKMIDNIQNIVSLKLESIATDLTKNPTGSK